MPTASDNNLAKELRAIRRLLERLITTIDDRDRLHDTESVSIDEAARELGLRPATVRAMCRSGAIRASKHSKSWRIKESEIRRYVEQGNYNSQSPYL